MVTSEMMQEMVQGKRPAFIFTCKGTVQHIDNANGRGVAIATTREAAKRLAEDMTKSKGEKVSVVEVGTLQGETLARHLALAAIDFKADWAHVTDDGETMYGFKLPPVPDDDDDDNDDDQDNRRRGFLRG